MTMIATLNLALYAGVIIKVLLFFRSDACRRDQDKVIAASLGAMSMVFVMVQLMVLFVFFVPTYTQQATSMLYMFCLANGVVYLTVIDVMANGRKRDEQCSTQKRYFP